MATGAARSAPRMAVAANANYTHHSVQANANATATAASRAGMRGWGPAASPVATTDSPGAMITNSAYRSVRWEGSNRTRASRRRAR
jgi:hypothetical protein